MAATLTSAEREFFQEVSAAAFANPFSAQRQELDRKITGSSLREPQRIGRLREAVTSRVAKLEASERAHLKYYQGEEVLIMRNVFLFEIYHGQCDALDGLIAEQLKAGDSSSAVPFAREALSELAARGFNEADALRFFAIFFPNDKASNTSIFAFTFKENFADTTT